MVVPPATGQIETATFTTDLVHQKNEKWRFGYSAGNVTQKH